MRVSRGCPESPTPQELAAYADGELDGSDALAPLRHKIEAWLEKHPAARGELEAQRHLRRIWDATTPPEPSEQAWERLVARLPAEPCQPPRQPPLWTRTRWLAAGAAIAAAVALFFVLRTPEPAVPTPPAPQPGPFAAAELDDGAPLQVASADEIEILSVAGSDMHTLAVRGLSVRDLLELLGPGELTLMEPARDAGIRVRNDGQTAPVVWARTDAEMNDD
jgi:ferric-dicitrate binding protein FerR (iron transport regulator)